MGLSADSLAPFRNQLVNAKHCYVGFSGGMDSHVLLHLLLQLVPRKQLTAIHINHRLSPRADAWAKHCRGVCAELGVGFIGETVRVATVAGVEEAARQARYRVFQDYLQAGALLLLAHHRDDQAETVLFRLLRGSGPVGLAGIPEQRPLGEGRLLRPLLMFSREKLAQYAAQEHLSWIEDESNRDLNFDRNFIRHRIIPEVAEHWPDYGGRLGHSARLAGEAVALLAELAEQDLALLGERQERLGASIDTAGLLSLSPERQANLLRHWIAGHHYPVPGHKIMETLLEQTARVGSDARMLVAWTECEIRKFRNRLFLLPAGAAAQPGADWKAEWDLTSPLVLPDGATIAAEPVDSGGLAIPPGAKLEVGFRQGGETCTPAGRAGSNNLKTLFQEYGLEPWLRQRAPLFYLNGELVAVGDVWVCQPFATAGDQRGYRLRWTLPGSKTG